MASIPIELHELIGVEHAITNGEEICFRQDSKISGKSNAIKISTESDNDEGFQSDLFESTCSAVLQLKITQEEFNEKVKSKRKNSFLNHHTAEIEVAVDLFIKSHDSCTDKALLALMATPCSQSKELVLVTKILCRGVNTRATDKLSYSPLHYAVQKGHIVVAEKLLQNGASPSQRDSMGYSPAQLALASMNDPMAAILIRYMKNSEVRELFLLTENSPASFSFHSLIENGGMKETVLAVLDSSIDFNNLGLNEASVHYSVLECDRKGLTPEREGFTERDGSALHLLSRSMSEDLICHPVVSLHVERKWRLFASSRFMATALLYLLFLVVMTSAVALALECENPAVYTLEARDVVRAICESIIVLSIMYSTFSEILELINLRKDYFLDPFNVCDVGANVLLFAVIPLRFTNHPSQWGVYSAAYLLSTMKAIKFAALFRQLRTYARIMFILTTRKIWEFVVMVFLVSLAFSGSFSLSLRIDSSLDKTRQSMETGSFWRVLWSALRVGLEEGPIIKYYDENGFTFGWYSTALLMAYLFFILVMLTNILIAQLTDIYDYIKHDAKVEVELNRAFIVTRVEKNAFLPLILKKDHYRKRFYVEKEQITGEKLQEYRLRINHRSKDLVRKDDVITEQIGELDASMRSICDRLKKQDIALTKIIDFLNLLNTER